MVKKRKKVLFEIVALAFLFLFLISSTSPLFASSYSSTREKAKKSENQIKSLKKSLNIIADEYCSTSSRLETAKANLSNVEQDISELQGKADECQDYLGKKARFLYKAGPGNYLETMFSSLSIQEFLSNLKYMQMLSDYDSKVFIEATEAKIELSKKKEDLKKQKADYEYLLSLQKNKRKELEKKLNTEKALYAKLSGDLQPKKTKTVSRSGKNYRISGFVFPVSGPHAFSNTFGAPRRGHRHQGTDIFAIKGTPCVACVSGTVKLSRGGNGGIMLYINGNDGNTYFYAHLNGYAKGIYSGKRVTAGQVVGYVGNTGNARGGADHLHFEIRPKGGRAINPYYILREAD